MHWHSVFFSPQILNSSNCVCIYRDDELAGFGIKLDGKILFIESFEKPEDDYIRPHRHASQDTQTFEDSRLKQFLMTNYSDCDLVFLNDNRILVDTTV